jgi:hypothetical protein
MDNLYKGMTVNERLYVSGLIEEFDLAVEKKKKDEIIAILKKVEITDESAIELILKELYLSQ